jgi:very-short-patch-repair endonuclease
LNEPRTNSAETQKAVRLVDYLTRLASLRSKVIRKIDEYQKVLWVEDVPKQTGCFTQAWGRNEDYDSDVWVEVQTRREPELPSIPPLCQEWVEMPSLRNKHDLPELLPEITRQVATPNGSEGSDRPEFISHSEYLRDHPEVQRAWDSYVEEKWLLWTEEHNAWEIVHKGYSELFAIHQEQIRLGEEYELVLASGLLTWQTPSGQQVRRHLLVADALLEFEARLGKFILRPHTEGAKLRPELDMLDIEEQPTHAEERAKAALESVGDDPWSKDVEAVLQSLAHSLGSRGEYDGCLEADGDSASTKPVVKYAPALILRKRSIRGLTETLTRIKDQIEEDGEIPVEFRDLAEIQSIPGATMDSDSSAMRSKVDGEVFFPKPSNEEQRRIVDEIRRSSSVLVQGPPGTGKSHTIANLICHLLATGQRTLITAKTPRALQVLEGLVPVELRPLCINLLGSGLEERRSLESSVGGILRKNEEWNENQANQERANLEGQLRQLREEKATVDRRLRDIRESESHSQSIAEGTYQGTAARIAEAVNRHKKTYGWFTDTVPVDKTCPISESDLQNILDGLRHFSPEKRRELSLERPKALPSTARLANLAENEKNATAEESNLVNTADEHIVALLSRSSRENIEAVQDALSNFRDTRRRLITSPHSWMADTLRDVISGTISSWRERLRATRDSIDSIETLVPVADDTSVEFPGNTNIRTLHTDACTLSEHMRSGGNLGWGPFRPKIVRERIHVIKTVRVNGRACSTLDEFELLADVLRVRLECEKAWNFWAGLTEKTQGPYTLQLPELKALCDDLEEALSLERLLERCRETIRQCRVIGEPVWSDETQAETLTASCCLALARNRKRLVEDDIRDIEVPISALAAKSNAHPVANDLLWAIRQRNVDHFAHAIDTVTNLDEEHRRLQKIDEQVSMMERLLPRVTDELTRTYDNVCWNERVHQIQRAWQWMQARCWVEEYIQQEDAPALITRAKQIEDEINDTVATLASLYAWSFCFSRLEEHHRRHMEAWQQSMRRLGKGTGKHAPRHRQEAQQHLNQCREAVPAWVMPLHRVWDTVAPAPGMFDVIIVDEASQCGVEAMPLLYLGRKVLIVGDDKQISPDAVGLPRDAVHRLMEEFLYDFRFKSSFDVESSLFDHGKLRYGTRRITLREHFRCMPEIIRFSNDLSYSDTPLIPLRQYRPNRLPPLEHVFVRGGYREGSGNRTVNRPEAEAIVDKIVDLCGDSRYHNKSIGVVVLQGEAQGSLIEGHLLDRLGAEEIQRRRLVCGNPYSFQGDERDIMFLSMVAATNERIGPLTRAADQRRFNVAASRGRDQMYLFHSVTCDDLSVSCLRRHLLEFFETTGPHKIAGINREELERRAVHDNRNVVSPPKPFDSWFEVDVALEVARRGFNVIPQYEIVGRRIDLVIESGNTRLAVECDGDRWHGADRYEEDMQRQRQLERCGWEFFRVRASAFYSNREIALQGLWRALEERCIVPGRSQSSDVPEPMQDESKDDRMDRDEAEDRNEEGNLGASSDNNFGGPDSRPTRHVGEISTSEIQDAILQVLSKCPSQSCTIESMTKHVLKELGIVTRGKPRTTFKRRVVRSIGILERRELVERYKAKNPSVRQKHVITGQSNSPTTETRSTSEYVYSFKGVKYRAQSAREVMIEVFKLLSNEDPGFLERFASRRHGDKRRYLARDRSDLYPGQPDLAASNSRVAQVGQGWWIGTNYNRKYMQKIIDLACEVAGNGIGSKMNARVD